MAFFRLLVFTLLVATSTVYLNYILPIEAASRKPKNDHLGLNCTNHMDIIDSCSSMTTWSFTTASNQFPQNSAELKKSCDRTQEGIKCIKIYNKCLVPVARRTVNAFASGRSRHLKTLCPNVNSAKSIEFTNGFNCIYSSKRNKYFDSERELISSLQLVATKIDWPWEERFHQACCSAVAYTKKVTKDSEPECTKAKEPMEDMFDSTVGDLLEAACPPPQRLEEICPKLPKLVLPKVWSPISLTRAALEVITNLAETVDRKQKN